MPRPTEAKAQSLAEPNPSAELAKLAVHALDDLKGIDIKELDVRRLTAITDIMLICTGTSNRHVKALADNVIDEAKQAGYRPHSIQGTDAGEWIIVDLGGVVVHVMQAQARVHYQLEKLWSLDVGPEETGLPVSDKGPVHRRALRKSTP